MSKQPERFGFHSCMGSRKVHRDGNMVVVTFGDIDPLEVSRFKYGTQKTQFQQEAQRVIEQKDPLIIDEEDDFPLIDDDDMTQ